jgi:hypothetical protein
MDRKIVMSEDLTPEETAPHIVEVMMNDARAASIRGRLELHIQQAGGYDSLEIESSDEAIALCEKLSNHPGRPGLLCLENFLREMPKLRRI